jgi:hypothetical protein
MGWSARGIRRSDTDQLIRRRRHATTTATAARARTIPVPTRAGAADPADGRSVGTGAASTILVCRLPPVGAEVVVGDVVAVVGSGCDVVVALRRTLPRVSSVVDDDARTTGGGTPVGVVDGGGESTGVVLGGVVPGGALVVVVVVVVPDVLVARTDSGEKVGWPDVPSMSVAPKVQASTLPGGGR